MRNEKLLELFNDEYNQVIERINNEPDDIATLKKLLAEVIAYNKIILDKANRYMG
ncbi:hypothetical protein [Herbinix luporum]|jgi:hypothetical protein|uniref:Uncharacterized protein n=1 Tax=Herbinix luporum TaxID=1679721 RepID=A0A0K8J407_9FIRM|nr:hypothetical protein [Herbinix luporum]CUH92202.1 hypothetical protein SD1D_0654 [Herbinix luporum]